MGLPDKGRLLVSIEQAIVEAELIAVTAKADPTKYVQPEVIRWGVKWISSRFAGVLNDPAGVFDQIVQEAERAVRSDFPGVSLPGLDFQSFTNAEATGEATGSQAVLAQIALLKTRLQDVWVGVWYVTYQRVIDNGRLDSAAAISVYQNLFLELLRGFRTLYNTMLKKMAQGDKPKPRPGPGQHIVRTPFGEAIVDDAPGVVPEDSVALAQVTVGQFRLLLREELRKAE